MAKAKRIYEYSYTSYLGNRGFIKVLEDGKIEAEYYNMMEGEDELKASIEEKTIKRIQQAMKAFPEFFNIKKAIEPVGLIADGYFEIFYADSGEKSNDARVSNWGFCDDCDELTAIDALHNRVAEILIEEGIDRKYFYAIYDPE